MKRASHNTVVLIRQTPRPPERVAFIRSTTIDAALGTADPREIEEVAGALASLAQRLSPDMVTRMHAGRTTR